MSNFLFQNISAIFAAPAKVVEILNKTEAVKDTVKVTNNTAQNLNLDENGDVNVPKSTIVGVSLKRIVKILRLSRINLILNEVRQFRQQRLKMKLLKLMLYLMINTTDFMDKLKENISKAVDSIVEEAKQTTVKAVETDKKMKEKKTIEDCVRDHLRGFSRTIPSFLMAYGDGDNITLAEFDNIVPGGVFEEVTSITLDEFKFLRDGGDYVDEETGETKHFEGKLFDEIVFNDSITIFLNLKKEAGPLF